MSKLLVVEDDMALGFVIQDSLKENGYDVTLARTGTEAMELLHHHNFDLLVLDVMLPGVDGFSLAEKVRKTDKETPILFLSAKSMVEDRIEGLKKGGDDYLTKPFSMEELILKISIFLKRSSNVKVREYSIGTYIFTPESLSLRLGSKEQKLTQKESQLLELLCSRMDTVIKREEILEQIWGSNDYFLGRSMDVFISKLRKHFKDDQSINIINYHGVGFRLEVK